VQQQRQQQQQMQQLQQILLDRESETDRQTEREGGEEDTNNQHLRIICAAYGISLKWICANVETLSCICA